MTSESPDSLPPTYLDGPPITRDNCEREPIQIPGSIQPQGALLMVDPATLSIVQASENVQAYLGFDWSDLLGAPLTTVLNQATLSELLVNLPEGVLDTLQYRTILAARPAAALTLTAHRAAGRFVLEFERRPEVAPDPQVLRNALFNLENADSLLELANQAVRTVRELTGFDRVMLYRFLPDDSGEVIAEVRREGLGSFLGHRFPESDIPRQARALYVRHLLRLTADVHDQAVPLHPVLDPITQNPASLGGAVLRATSPIHVQYLRNMGVASSLSVSVVVDGRLWGLIACHHQTGLVISPDVRSQLEYVGRLLNWQVRVKDRLDTDRFRAALQEQYAQLLKVVATTEQPLQSLSEPELGLLELMRASGVILAFEGQLKLLGDVPSEAFAQDLLRWLTTHQPNQVVWLTDALGQEWPEANSASQQASGVLAISVGTGWQEAVIWLRPEVQTSVAWGGATPELAKGELGPRTSFETYRQRVQGVSVPWHPGEVEQADSLQVSLTASLGERLSALRNLNLALERSNHDWQQFAFVISHDMQEPVRLINVYSELLQMRYTDHFDQKGERILGTITQEALRLRSLVSDLQIYSDLRGHAHAKFKITDLNIVFEQALKSLQPEIQAVQAQIEVEPLPTIEGAAVQLQTLFRHLLHNALTFTEGRIPHIGERCGRQGAFWEIAVSDNGPGIDAAYHDRIFNLFQRLSSNPKEGRNGIGLALCRYIAELHGGHLRVAAHTQGATFILSLPVGSGL